MTKRLHLLTILIVILLVPSFVMAGANKFGAAKAISTGDNMMTVPLVITNEANLAAMDIPLTFSDGVILRDVDFENTRVNYFDFKIANIDNEAQTVNIGLMPQMSSNYVRDLEAGTGVVANLIFEVIDPTIDEITVEAYTTESPSHDLIFVYHGTDSKTGEMSLRSVTRDGSSDGSDSRIEFESFTVTLAKDGGLPTAFSLDQNYPNPFNPTTTVAYAVPKASHVTVAIYNVLGQEVTLLVDEMKDVGNYEVTWDAGSYASGLYFYRITTDEFSDTKKMMLLK